MCYTLITLDSSLTCIREGSKPIENSEIVPFCPL